MRFLNKIISNRDWKPRVSESSSDFLALVKAISKTNLEGTSVEHKEDSFVIVTVVNSYLSVD